MARKPTAAPAAMTVAGVAAQLGVHRDAVYAWIASGELAATNVGTVAGKRALWRITEQAIEDFQRRRSNEPKPAAVRRRRQPVAVVGGNYF